MLHAGLHQADKATAYAEESLKIRRELNDRQGEMIALSNLGIMYRNFGEDAKAKHYAAEALVVAREIKDGLNEAHTLDVLGLTTLVMGNYDEAEGYYRQQLDVSRRTKDRYSESSALTGPWIISSLLGEHEKQRDHNEAALALARSGGTPQDEARALTALGGAYSNLGQFEKARDLYEQSLAVSLRLKDRFSEGDNLNRLGGVYAALGLYEEAREHHERALAAAREMKNRNFEGRVLWDLMELANRQKNPRLAILYGKRAVNAFQEVRGNIRGFDKESQDTFLKDKEQAYRGLAGLLIARGRIPEAGQALAMLKQAELYEHLRAREQVRPVRLADPGGRSNPQKKGRGNRRAPPLQPTSLDRVRPGAGPPGVDYSCWCPSSSCSSTAQMTWV